MQREYPKLVLEELKVVGHNNAWNDEHWNYFNIHFKGDVRYGNLKIYTNGPEKGEIYDYYKVEVLYHQKFDCLKQIEETLRQNQFNDIEVELLLNKVKDINNCYYRYLNNEPLEEIGVEITVDNFDTETDIAEYVKRMHQVLDNKFSIREFRVKFGHWTTFWGFDTSNTFYCEEYNNVDWNSSLEQYIY